MISSTNTTTTSIEISNSTESFTLSKVYICSKCSRIKETVSKTIPDIFRLLKINELTIEEKANSFYKLIEHIGRNWLETELLKFFRLQNQRAERKEISTETIKNYLKPIKLFCQMNGILINWKLISKGIKKGNRHSAEYVHLLLKRLKNY